MQVGHSGSGVDYVVSWLRLLLTFRILPGKQFSVLQKRVATRSVKKGLGIPNRQRQIRKTLTGLPCLPSSEMEEMTHVDAWNRQRSSATHIQS